MGASVWVPGTARAYVGLLGMDEAVGARSYGPVAMPPLLSQYLFQCVMSTLAGQSLRWYVCVWPWCPIAGVVDVNVALGFVEHTCTAGRAG